MGQSDNQENIPTAEEVEKEELKARVAEARARGVAARLSIMENQAKINKLMGRK